MSDIFAKETVMRAWLRAASRCECKRMTHGHSGRCNRLLVWGNRGRDGWGGWEAGFKDNRSDTALSNCEILCWQCHSHRFSSSSARSGIRPLPVQRI